MRCAMLLLVFLAGCMANPRIEDLSPEQRAAVLKVQVLDKPPEKYTSLGQVTGLSCNRNKFQAPQISEAEATEGIRINAARLGADAVVNMVCQTSSDADWRNNCFASVKCIGDAVKLTDAH